jgi:hypothetical protein
VRGFFPVRRHYIFSEVAREPLCNSKAAPPAKARRRKLRKESEVGETRATTRSESYSLLPFEQISRGFRSHLAIVKSAKHPLRVQVTFR